jgi:hypothetical protein
MGSASGSEATTPAATGLWTTAERVQRDRASHQRRTTPASIFGLPIKVKISVSATTYCFPPIKNCEACAGEMRDRLTVPTPLEPRRS